MPIPEICSGEKRLAFFASPDTMGDSLFSKTVIFRCSGEKRLAFLLPPIQWTTRFFKKRGFSKKRVVHCSGESKKASRFSPEQRNASFQKSESSIVVGEAKKRVVSHLNNDPGISAFKILRAERRRRAAARESPEIPGNEALSGAPRYAPWGNEVARNLRGGRGVACGCVGCGVAGCGPSAWGEVG